MPIQLMLDEDVPVPLRHDFDSAFDVETVEYRGWKSAENGDLLRRAEAEYDVFVTLDKNLPSQQNIGTFDIGVVVLCGNDVRLPALRELMPEANEMIRSVERGTLARVFPPNEATP